MPKLFSELFGWRAAIQTVGWSLIATVLGRLWLSFAGIRLTTRHEIAFWVLGLVTVGCVATIAATLLRQSERPRFVIAIIQVTTTDAPRSVAPDCVGIMIVADIVNRGGPSSAGKWALVAQVQGGTPKQGLHLVVPKPFTMPAPDAERTITFVSDEALYNKTLVPIPQGGMQVGLLWFEMPIRRDLLEGPGTRFTLSCKDAYGRLFSCTWVNDDADFVGGGRQQSIAEMSWPGLERRINGDPIHPALTRPPSVPQ